MSYRRSRFFTVVSILVLALAFVQFLILNLSFSPFFGDSTVFIWNFTLCNNNKTDIITIAYMQTIANCIGNVNPQGKCKTSRSTHICSSSHRTSTLDFHYLHTRGFLNLLYGSTTFYGTWILLQTNEPSLTRLSEPSNQTNNFRVFIL